MNVSKPRVGQRIVVKVPATTSNLGPGFDVLGLALTLYNEMELTFFPGKDRAIVEIEGEGAGTLPRSERNLALRSFRTLLPKRRFSHGLRLRMTNRIPLCRGLGSSAAARLAGMLAAATIIDPQARRLDALVERACRMEGHPDNVVPAFFGGLCASYKEEGEVRFFRLRPPQGLSAVLCVPDFEIPTEKARRIMPKRVPLKTAVRTASRLALLVSAFEQRRFDRLSAGMDDVLHQPYRRRLIPGMDDAIAAALRAGAFGAALSGSGPTVFALAPGRPEPEPGPVAREIGRAMQRAFARRGLSSRVHVLGIDTAGAHVRTYAKVPEARTERSR